MASKNDTDAGYRIITSFTAPRSVKTWIENEAEKQNTSQTQIILRGLAMLMNIEGNGDPWDISDDGWYSPKSFYTVGEDKKGHSVKVYTTIPKNLSGEISKVVESGLIPEYQNRTHFFRDAIYHRVKQVAGMLKDGDLEGRGDVSMMLAAELQLQQERDDTAQLISAMRDNCHHALSNGHLEFLDNYLSRREEYANRIPEQDRQEFIDTIKEFRKKLRLARKSRIAAVD